MLFGTAVWSIQFACAATEINYLEPPASKRCIINFLKGEYK